MVRDTENLTFLRNFVVVLRRHPQIVVRYDVDLLQGGSRSSLQVDMSLPRIRVKNGVKQKANCVHNNAEGSRKTSQGSFE